MKGQLLLLKALSDETRLNIVSLLLGGERCVCEIFPVSDGHNPPYLYSWEARKLGHP